MLFRSFFADVSSEMAYPFIPIFLTSVLGAPVAAVGAIEGIAESTASLMKLASGWWSDRVRRRLPLVVAGYGLAAVAKVLLALASIVEARNGEELVAALVEIAMGDPEGNTPDGASATSQLEQMAWGLGWTKEQTGKAADWAEVGGIDRKSTRLNFSH